MEGNRIFYFNPCCGGFDSFGIQNESTPFVHFSGFTDTVGTFYAVEIVNSYFGDIIYSGCVEYSGSSSTPISGLDLKSGDVTFTATTCNDCTNDIFPCSGSTFVSNPPIVVGYKNDCGIITILPMSVECEVSNPSSYDAADGEVSVVISGGTAPYTTTWLGDPNIVALSLNGVKNGSYTATTVDYWGDFTATTVCKIKTEIDCVFSGSISNYTPSLECYCSTYTFQVNTSGYVCWTTCDGENECSYYNASIEIIESPCLRSAPGGGITILSETICGNWCDPLAPIPPLPIDPTKDYYTIQITDGGISNALYTIYYNGTPNSIIPLTYPSGTSATNLSLTELQSGVVVEVPKDTGVIYIYTPLCPDNTVVLIVPKITTYSDFCLTIKPNRRRPQIIIHFTYGYLDSNNNPVWVGDDTAQSTVNKVGNQWILSTNFYGYLIFSNSSLTLSTTYPSNWSSINISEFTPVSILSVYASEGSCLQLSKELPPVSVNQPTCLCDGSIIFNIELDNPPLNYSIDNGVTYYSLPIFTDLCSGFYSLSVVDSLGDTYSSSVTLNKPTQSIIYTISLYTTDTTPVNNNTSIVKSYETTVVVEPSLPDGTTITFDLIHNNSFYSSPNSGTSILNTSTLLYKNNSGMTLSDTSNSVNQLVNTTPGCQKEYIYQSNINDTWNSLTISNSDIITISTTSRVDKTTLGECVVGYSNDTYSISNPIISGCDCCSIKIN